MAVVGECLWWMGYVGLKKKTPLGASIFLCGFYFILIFVFAYECCE